MLLPVSELLPADEASLRVGDDERRAVDEQLHRAVGAGRLTLTEYDERARDVWAARTRGELAALVRDLPGDALAPAHAVSGTRRAVAVMSEERLQGPVGDGVEGYAVMGSAKLDLRREDLPRRVRVRAVAVMGDVSVLVPDGATVHLTGMSLMGDRSVRLGAAQAGAPVVELSAFAVMGSVTVRSGPAAPGTRGLPVPAAPGQVPARPRGRGGRRVALVLAGVLGLGALGVLGEDGPGDRVERVPDGATTYSVDTRTDDVTVVVPAGVRVEVEQTGRTAEVDCDEACEGPGRVLRLTVSGTGELEVERAGD